MYRVLLHNDDYTTMDFVVKILEEVFHKTQEESVAIMMSVHQKGMGVCGVYPKEIAEFRVTQVAARAQHAGFPPALHHGKGIALGTAVACCGRRFFCQCLHGVAAARLAEKARKKKSGLRGAAAALVERCPSFCALTGALHRRFALQRRFCSSGANVK